MTKLLPISINTELQQIIKEQRFLSALTVFYILSVIWGTYRFYTPIPVLDMWDGYVDFHLQLLKGHSEVWWSQHNEHRPILARILFYIDHAALGGRSLLLIPLNVFLLFCVWYMVLVYAARFLERDTGKTSFYLLLVLLTVCCFSWKQDENIIWGFQGQFWLAFLLPLLGFYFLARSAVGKEKELHYFSLACLFGVLSAGTMANGIVALPLMTIMSLALRKKPAFNIILAVCTVVIVSIYLHGYQTPTGHDSFVTNAVSQPGKTLIFFIEYIGVIPKNIYASFIFGLVHLYLISVVLSNTTKHMDNPFYLSVVAFLLYYLATALVTSAGRVDYGLNAALVGRYTTPAFMSFTLSLILYLFNRPQHFRYFNKRTVVIIAVLMLGTQARTVIKHVDRIHDVRDREVMYMITGTYLEEALKYGTDEGSARRIRDIAAQAYDRKLSIFGMEPFAGKREKLGTELDVTKCRQVKYGNLRHEPALMLDVSEQIPINEAVYITGQDKRLIGYGLPSRQFDKAVSLIFDASVGEYKGAHINLYRCK